MLTLRTHVNYCGLANHSKFHCHLPQPWQMMEKFNLQSSPPGMQGRVFQYIEFSNQQSSKFYDVLLPLQVDRYGTSSSARICE